MNNGLLVFVSPVLYNAMNEQDGILNQFLSLFENWSREGLEPDVFVLTYKIVYGTVNKNI